MGDLIVGIGDIVVSRHAEDRIKTYGLGSCVALVMYSPFLRIAAMAHVALPNSSIDQKKAMEKPGYFADTAVPQLIRILKELGVRKNHQVWVKLIGGANILDRSGNFNIGKRNVLAVKKHLWKYRLGAIAEEVGDNISRTVTLQVKDGKIFVSSPEKGKWTL